jgi:hypothetical protein
MTNNTTETDRDASTAYGRVRGPLGITEAGP